MAAESSKVRRLPGNLNSSDIYLTLSKTSSIFVTGNCNSIRISVTDVRCPRGGNCSSRKPTDSPVEVSGNMNSYRFICTSYGLAPEELVNVTGNMNRVRTETKESIKCDCRRPSDSVDEVPGQAIPGTSQASLGGGTMLDIPQGQAPPAYEPRREETQQERPEETKVLLASSISSLESLDGRESLETLR